MKKLLAILLALVMVFTFAACGGDNGETATEETTTEEVDLATWDFSQDDTYNLAFSFYLPDGNGAYDWITPLVEGIEEKTQGTVHIDVYPGATLAAGDETADAIKNGVCDMGLVPTAYGLGTFPLCYMLEYPGVDYGSAKAASYAMKEWIETLQPAETADYKVMFGYCAGPGVFLTRGKQIQTVEDFAGLQIRTNSCNAPAVSAYGGTPVTLAVSEVYESMRTGVIDGYCGLDESLLAFNLQEVTEYAIHNPNFQCAFLMLMNQDVYNSMSAGQQAAIDEVSEEVWEQTACCFLERDWSAKAMQALEDAGVEVLSFSDEDIAKMNDLTANILTDYAAELDSQGINGTEALELWKELVAKYNEIYPTND